MWKCFPRRVRELERGVNHLDKCGTSPFANCAYDEKNKRPTPPCEWFRDRGCWGSHKSKNNTNNSNKWNLHQLASSWLNAISWSGVLVFGWYTSQVIQLKYKTFTRRHNGQYPPTLLSSLHPYIMPANNSKESLSKLEKLLDNFTPTVHLVANEQIKEKNDRSIASNSSGNPDLANDLMGEVLNSIENKLGLAAIENGQHQEGLKLLKSAADRKYAPALFNLGICYEMGLGVTVNEKIAMELFRSAATLEHPDALYNLGIYYGQGRGGLSRDTITATRLLKLAAVQGHQDAINALKYLDTDTDEPAQTKPNTWTYLNNLQLSDNSVLPIPSLLIENVNYIKPQHEGTIY